MTDEIEIKPAGEEENKTFLAFRVKLTDKIKEKLDSVDEDFTIYDGSEAEHKIPHITIVGPRKSFDIDGWKGKIDEKIDEKPTKFTITSFNSFWDSSKLGFKGELDGEVDIDTPHLVLFNCEKDKEGTKSTWGSYEPIFSEFEGTELDIESIAIIERNKGVVYKEEVKPIEEENFDERNCRKFYDYLNHEGGITELRAFGKGKPRRKFVDNGEDFVDFCGKWSGKRDVYAGVNPRKKKGGSNEDVLKIINIPMDWDAVRPNPKETPASEKELETAIEKVKEIADETEKLGYERPTIDISGNGCHPIFKIPPINLEEHNLEEREERLNEFQKQFIKDYNREGVDPDPIGDPARIIRVWGTKNLKGEGKEFEEDRRNRLAEPLEINTKPDRKLRDYIFSLDIERKETEEKIKIDVDISEDIPLRNPLGLTFSQLCRKDEKLGKLADDLKPDEWAKRKKKKDLDSSRSGADYDFVKKLIFYGYTDGEIAHLLRKHRPYEKTERDDYIERTIEKARKAVDSTVEDYKNAENKRDAMVRLAEEHTEEKIIDDITGEPFVGIEGSDYTQVIPAESEEFEEWLTGEWISKGLSLPSRQTISDAAWAFSAEVKHDYDDRRELHLRVGRYDGAIYYDLGDPEWHAVKITEDDWEIIEDGPNIFQRWPHQKEQTKPADEGDVEALRELTNTSSEIDDLMLEVYLATTLVPNIPHLLPIIHGPQGAAKTDLMKMMRELIDPSSLKVMSEPKSMDDAVVQLNANYMAFFDNLRGMSDRLADVLCRAVTGSGYSKRKLYTDRNQAVFNYRRCVGFNTISGMPDQPDLLDRALVIELDHIHGLDRELEETIWRKFYEKRPKILAGLFDLVSEAMGTWEEIKQEINEDERIKMPRMADAAAWGEAIARAKDLDKWEYLEAFNKKIGQRETFVLENNPIGKAVLYLMEGREEHSGTPKELLETLNGIASNHDDVETDHDNWPSNAPWVTKRLKQVEADLSKFGIELEFGERPGSGGRFIKINNRESTVTKESTVTTVTGFLKEESERNSSNGKSGSNSKSQTLSPKEVDKKILNFYEEYGDPQWTVSRFLDPLTEHFKDTDLGRDELKPRLEKFKKDGTITLQDELGEIEEFETDSESDDKSPYGEDERERKVQKCMREIEQAVKFRPMNYEEIFDKVSTDDMAIFNDALERLRGDVIGKVKGDKFAHRDNVPGWKDD